MSKACPPNTVAYTVQAGDTFYSLANRYNTTVAALVSANPGVNPDALVVGQTICIPRQQGYPPCPEGNYYTIKAGDNFYAIARSFNVSLDDLLEANPGIDPDRLQVGQVICIPLATPPVTCGPGTTSYTVQAGDTLTSIAARNNTTVNAILAVNPGLNPNVLLIGQIICIPTAVPPTTCPAGTVSYTIVAGDTLSALARRYNTTVSAIVAANPGIDPNSLRVGQIICIPSVAPPPTCPPGTVSYTIVAGDTLSVLARRFNTTVEAIIAANPGIDPNSLRVAQIICIPTVTPPPTTCPIGTTSYTIKAGDTLYALARQFNTTVSAITAANPGIDPNSLRVGQIICIPGVIPPETCPSGTISYTIRSGDTLYALASRFNTSVSAIVAANPGINPNTLQIGQKICIPQTI